MASNPFVLSQNGSASTFSLVLTVTSSTQNGDNIVVGVCINTTPAVPRVTDSQGNTYTGVVTDTTETGEQIWTFESPGAAALLDSADSGGFPDTITIVVTQA
jgi:hypothetical protein